MIKKIENMIKTSLSNMIFLTRYKKYLKTNKKKKFIIVNAPNHGNLGDQAILIAEEKLLKENNINYFVVKSINTEFFLKKYKDSIEINDIIFVHGGGNLGTIWEREQQKVNMLLNSFSNNKIIIFPQTVYYSEDINGRNQLDIDNKIYTKCKNLTLFCRDRMSYEYAKKHLAIKSIYLTPDIVTILNKQKRYNRRGILLCFRDDREVKISDYDKNIVLEYVHKRFPEEKIDFISTVEKKFFMKNKYKEIDKLLKKISKSKIVITDRLHGMIFSAITGTECVALSNTSGKVYGAYEWLNKYNRYIHYANNTTEVDNILENIEIKSNDYENSEFKEIIQKIIELL